MPETLVEEPAATGVHQLGVALELEQLERGDALARGEGVGGVASEEAVLAGGGTVEHQLDVGVARGPEVGEQAFGELFGQRRGCVAEKVEGFAQGRAPLLVPAGLAAVAAAVGAPAFDAVRAAPGGVLDDLSLPLRRKFLQELAVVGEAGVAVDLNPVHGVGERHLAVLVVVAVALAVGGDVGELRAGGGLAVARGSRPAGARRRLRRCSAGLQRRWRGRAGHRKRRRRCCGLRRA